MLLVTQFPICDARSFSGAAEARLPRPNWPPETGVPRQFVRRFGQATVRRRGADPAWNDEYAFVDARHAIGLEGLTAGLVGQPPDAISLRGAFRRLLCDPSRTTVRVEIGVARRRRDAAEAPLDGSACGSLVEALLLTPTHVPSPTDEEPSALGACGSRLAALYARSTTKWSSAQADEGQRLVQAGQPLVVVEFDNAKFSEDTEEWQMPDWATVVPPEAVNGARIGFGRIGRYNIGTWFIGAGEGDASQLRSLRLCLLRLHAMQEVLDCLLRLIDGNDVLYQPYSDSGDRLSEFLNDMTSKIGARSTHGVSQSAIVAAMDASVSVETPGDAETRIANLELARRQVAAKIRSYLRRRAAERQVVVFKGGITVTTNNHNNDITINGPVTNSSVILAETMENVRVAIQNSDASPELKAALATLQDEARQLAAQLPDDKSKKDVATAVETIATEACKPDPTEFLVRAAGDALIRAGTKVKECAEPIAKAVATVFTLLKLAVPEL